MLAFFSQYIWGHSFKASPLLGWGVGRVRLTCWWRRRKSLSSSELILTEEPSFSQSYQLRKLSVCDANINASVQLSWAHTHNFTSECHIWILLNNNVSLPLTEYLIKSELNRSVFYIKNVMKVWVHRSWLVSDLLLSNQIWENRDRWFGKLHCCWLHPPMLMSVQHCVRADQKCKNRLKNVTLNVTRGSNTSLRLRVKCSLSPPASVH